MMRLTWTQNDGVRHIVETDSVKFLPVITEANKYRLVINGTEDVWRNITQEQADALYKQLCAEYAPLELTLIAVPPVVAAPVTEYAEANRMPDTEAQALQEQLSVPTVAYAMDLEKGGVIAVPVKRTRTKK